MWYCYKRDYDGEFQQGVIRGRWYGGVGPLDSNNTIESVYLWVEGEETWVNLKDFIRREEKPKYSFAYETQPPAMEYREAIPIIGMSWFCVCPEGHRDPTTYTSPPAKHECSKCGIEYPVQTEDSALVIDA